LAATVLRIGGIDGELRSVAAGGSPPSAVVGFSHRRPRCGIRGGQSGDKCMATAPANARHVLVTGGSGFIGSALVRELVRRGDKVRVLDDNSRGALRRLREVEREVEFLQGDIRDAGAVDAAVRGVDEVHHLAFVNGTAAFYNAPALVLDVGVKGIVNVIDACRRHGVSRLILASSSEVYQSPPRIPTDESAPLVIPDPFNPRLSYAAGKIISEMLVINHGREHFERALIFRPHNVYGPDMGFDHVIPEFVVRLKRACTAQPSGLIAFAIQGSGEETRSFCHVDDLIAGVMIMRERGEHLGIYHVGTTEEVSIANLANRVAAIAGREITLRPSAAREGSAPRRSPDISKLAALGYRPRVPLEAGLPPVVNWYWEHESLAA
jgi:nucleoside-diphosphate-sugar epimerase